MKNRERYPKTEDAEKAYRADLQKYPLLKRVDLTFESWLDFRADEADEDEEEKDPLLKDLDGLPADIAAALSCMALFSVLYNLCKDGK